MTSTNTTIFTLDLINKIRAESIKTAVSFLRVIISSLWTGFKPYLPYAILVFVFIVVIAVIKAMLGQVGLLGSVTYHILFFGILGIIVAIFGLEIFFNAWFDLMSFLIYIFSFKLTGLIMNKFRREFRGLSRYRKYKRIKR